MVRFVIAIKVFYDDEANVWVAVNEEIGLALESESYDKLIERVLIAAPEMAAENGIACSGLEFQTNDRQIALA